MMEHVTSVGKQAKTAMLAVDMIIAIEQPFPHILPFVIKSDRMCENCYTTAIKSDHRSTVTS